MYTNKYITLWFLSLSIGFAACTDGGQESKAKAKVVLAQLTPGQKAKSQVQQAQLQIPASTKLDSMRILTKNEYARYLPEMKKFPPVTEVSPEPPINSTCAFCDIPFLARISKQGEVNQQDFNYLLCTNDNSCKNNAEFLEFYNEELFRFVIRQPAQFLKAFVVDSSKWDLVAFELANPVSDEYSSGDVIKILTGANNQIYDGTYRVPLNELFKRMNIQQK